MIDDRSILIELLFEIDRQKLHVNEEKVAIRWGPRDEERRMRYRDLRDEYERLESMYDLICNAIGQTTKILGTPYNRNTRKLN